LNSNCENTKHKKYPVTVGQD